jgi:hypothetical protein
MVRLVFIVTNHSTGDGGRYPIIRNLILDSSACARQRVSQQILTDFSQLWIRVTEWSNFGDIPLRAAPQTFCKEDTDLRWISTEVENRKFQLARSGSRNLERAANRTYRKMVNFPVARNRRSFSIGWIPPDRVLSTFTIELAPVRS